MRKRFLFFLYFFFIFLASYLIFLNSGCSPKQDKRRIALVVKTLSNPFFIDMVDAAKEEATKEDNFELIVHASERETDIDKQVQIIENLIVQRVDAICITPCDSRGIISVVIKANKAQIPVLIVDTKVDAELAEKLGAKIETFIGSDNYLGGKLAGQYIADKLGGKGKVVILEGVPGQETAISRKAGFIDYIREFPDVEIVASQPADWNREKGLNVFQNILQANPAIDALFACNDEMALGAIQAIRTAKREKEILIVGYDAIKDALDAIKSYHMDASIAQRPAEMGRLAVINAVKILNGEKIPSVIPTKVELITKGKIN